jgi:hypothetical protein
LFGATYVAAAGPMRRGLRKRPIPIDKTPQNTHKYYSLLFSWFFPFLFYLGLTILLGSGGAPGRRLTDLARPESGKRRQRVSMLFCESPIRVAEPSPAFSRTPFLRRRLRDQTHGELVYRPFQFQKRSQLFHGRAQRNAFRHRCDYG